MNKPLVICVMAIASLLLAISLSKPLGVCVYEGDPLDDIIQNCP